MEQFASDFSQLVILISFHIEGRDYLNCSSFQLIRFWYIICHLLHKTSDQINVAHLKENFQSKITCERRLKDKYLLLLPENLNLLTSVTIVHLCNLKNRPRDIY